MIDIRELLISKNRPKTALKPVGIVIHSTDNEAATARQHYNYWNSGDRQSSCHYVVDWTETIRLIPENEMAYHAGRTANKKYLSVEMCEPKIGDMNKFTEVWNRTIDLVADICVRYGWFSKEVLSHDDVSKMYKETTHTDPIGYLLKYGKSWGIFLKAIDNKIAELKMGQEIFVFGSKEEKFGAYLKEEYAKNKCNQLKEQGYMNIYYIKEGTRINFGEGIK